MKKRFRLFPFLFAAACLPLATCQKEIKVKLPELRTKICVEGKIEPGIPPFVILTYNMPYFGPKDLAAMQSMFVHNAVVKVNNGTSTITLTEYCTQNLSPSVLPIVAQFTGVDTNSLKAFNYCLYTSLNLADTGVVGKTYQLTVDVEGRSLHATTSIAAPIPLDSLWYTYIRVNDEGDSLGYLFAHLTDPSPEGNAYRWLAMREGKDYSFVPPPGSVFDDKFINGQSFDFGYNRGSVPNSTAEDDNNEEEGYFKIEDTITVKFCTIDHATFDFFRQLDVALYSQGNPFAAPTSVPSNIYPREDALGVWCGYGVYTKTIILK